MSTLKEEKKKVLALIEELNPDSQYLTDDPDIRTKMNGVINQVMFELCRMKKLPKYVELTVEKGDIITFAELEAAAGYEIYQVGNICGVNYIPKADNTVFKMLESGTAEIDCYIYPERITDSTNDNYEFELAPDVLEIMPYGVAADLLKSDVSTEYGSVYAQRYESMLQRLDPRHGMPSFYIEGGYSG